MILALPQLFFLLIFAFVHFLCFCCLHLIQEKKEEYLKKKFQTIFFCFWLIAVVNACITNILSRNLTHCSSCPLKQILYNVDGSFPLDFDAITLGIYICVLFIPCNLFTKPNSSYCILNKKRTVLSYEIDWTRSITGTNTLHI